MKMTPNKSFIPRTLKLLALATTLCTGLLWAQVQWPFTTPITPGSQRSGMQAVQSQIGWLQNSTRTAANYANADLVWQHFQAVRAAYNGFMGTLTQQQLNYGANDFAELSAGLDVIQEAFAQYENDLSSGRSASTALRSLCQVLRDASAVWLQEFNQDCRRLRVGMN
jgi:hypothetical protein